jgi:hypothetical protein
LTQTDPDRAATAEHARLSDADRGTGPWRDWGPYVSERAWGTVREDYSANGDAWNFFPHDHARSRVFRWNEDGMAAFCDSVQDWCLGLALWNGTDPILKERMFGLTGPQGNHGEDAKDYWWYLDGTPTHSWNTWRYHYPQTAFPYDDLVAENGRRDRSQPEYELLDTGIFDDGRYWVVTVDYAKAGPADLLMSITVENAGPDEATVHVLPTLWYRNTWSWGYPGHERPELTGELRKIVGRHWRAGGLALAGDGMPELLFCDNETNTERLFGQPNITPYPKDGINDAVVSGAPTVNPAATGTKAALHYRMTVPAGGSATVRVRLVGGEDAADRPIDLGSGFGAVLAQRRTEADLYWESMTPAGTSADEAMVMRQAFAGLLWSKQFYHYDVTRWLEGDPGQPPPPPGRDAVRNRDWRHLDNHEVLLMPDPWEYPWYAAWDLAFHCVTMAHIDPAFAKEQVILLLREWYMHPNGQIPAYEWNFSDVNPPVHAWAALRVFLLDGARDFDFLARVFHKLLISFTWWAATKDHGDNNLFEGGFLGLDNIAPIDRSTIPASVGYLEQSDATAWMAMYALDLLDIALRLAVHDPAYEDVATKFFEHFLQIASAANNSGLWDPQENFFFDVLHLAGGTDVPIRVRSLVGLVPLTAVAAFHGEYYAELPDFSARAEWYVANRPQTAGALHTRVGTDGVHRLAALVSPERLVAILETAFGTDRFLSDHGIRSISAWHRDHPFSLAVDGVTASIDYEPAESTTALFGGNSNWRGPIWFPLNILIVEALRDYDDYEGDDLTIQYPAGSGSQVSLGAVADDVSRRLISTFLRDGSGRRPVFGGYEMMQNDPRWRDNILFHEYFNGDTGAGLGAMHQTGWTATVAHLIRTMRRS